MSDIVSVYAKSGVTIPAHRAIRFTGNRKGPLWEVDLPDAADKRAHAMAMPGSSGNITNSEPGQARTFGPLVEAELSDSVHVDDELTTGRDGRLHKAKSSDKNRCGVALASLGAGAVCPVLLGWSELR